MPFTYDYTFTDGSTAEAATLSVPTTGGESGQVTPDRLLTLWRDEPGRAVFITSPTYGAGVRSLGDVASVTIRRAQQ